MKRDFTYVDDIIDGIVSSLERQYEYEIFNLGNSNQVELEHMISCVEKELGREAIRDYYPMQPGDVKSTFADIDKSTKLLGFSPKVTIEEGIHNFIKWYKEYYSC